jgi:hypothetical protein
LQTSSLSIFSQRRSAGSFVRSTLGSDNPQSFRSQPISSRARRLFAFRSRHVVHGVRFWFHATGAVGRPGFDP